MESIGINRAETHVGVERNHENNNYEEFRLCFQFLALLIRPSASKRPWRFNFYWEGYTWGSGMFGWRKGVVLKTVCSRVPPFVT